MCMDLVSDVDCLPGNFILCHEEAPGSRKAAKPQRTQRSLTTGMNRPTCRSVRDRLFIFRFLLCVLCAFAALRESQRRRLCVNLHLQFPAALVVTITAGIFLSRTSLLKAVRSSFITCFSFASWASACPARSS